MAEASIGWRESLGRFSFLLSALVLGTSLLDLFVNRLLFRAGPEVLKEISFPGISEVAVLGRIAFTFEQFVLYLILGGAAVLLFRERRALPRNLGLLLFPQMACAVLLYLPFAQTITWAVSMMLVLLTAAEVFGLIYLKARGYGQTSVGKELAGVRLFGIALGVAFFLPLYYRVSVLLVGLNTPALPFQMGAYIIGVYAIVVASVAALVYSLVVRTSHYRMGVRSFAKAALLPTLIVRADVDRPV